MNNRHLYILSALLFLLGSGFFLYKYLQLGFPLLPGQETSVWEVEIKLDFNANDRPAKVLLYVPRNTRNFSVINENFISRGYGISISTVDGNRQVSWSIRRASGQQALYYRATIERLVVDATPVTAKTVKVNPVSYEGADLEAAQSVLLEAKQKSADTLTLVTQLINVIDNYQNNDNVNLLLHGKPTRERKLEVIQNILSMEEIPSRLAHGLRISEQYGESDPVPWLEVYANGQWQAIDPVTGQAGQLSDYLLLWKGKDRMVNLVGGQDLSVSINIKQSGMESVVLAATREKSYSPDLWKYSLQNLPLDTQRVYAILLTVPVGVFLLVILRNIVGIKTFGTFMPVLIALAFRETQLVAGVVLFTLLVAVGLAIRFYLERLKLLLVPRLAAVLVIVILLMLSVSILSHNLGIVSGLSVSLFPMVILTMTIERMSVVWEERGASEAMLQGMGSLVTAAIAFMIMSMPLVEHLVTVFPELLFVMLAIILLLGRYSGYRLLELHRFKALVGR